MRDHEILTCLCLVFVGGSEDEVSSLMVFTNGVGEMGLVFLQVRALGVPGGKAWWEEVWGLWGELAGLV